VIADPISGGASLLYRTGSEQNFPLPDRPEILVGYAKGNDIVVPFEGVSRRHARISFDGKSYWIEDAGSANKTFVNGRRVIKKKRLEHLDVVTLGRRTDLIFVRKRLAPRRVTRRGILSAWLERLDGTEAGERREVPRGTMTIGRSAVNNIQTDNQLVSKIHARLERTATQLVLTDLHSANGTFVGSNRIQSCVLKDGDRFSLAGARSYRVRLEEGEIEMNAEEDPSGPAAASIPSLPTDWKTRIEWSPEERAAFGEAFRAAPSAQAAGPSVGAPPVGEPSAAPQAALSPENPAAVAASAQPGPAPVEAPSAAATGVEAPPQSPGEPVAGPAPLVEQSLPAADVRPSHRDGHDRDRAFLFHHRIVDRLRRRAREFLVPGVDDPVIALGGGECRFGGMSDVGHVTLDRAVPARRAGQENARVPIMMALREQRFRMVEVGFLDKMLDPANTDSGGGGNIAEAGRGMIGLDAEGDDVAVLRRGAPRLDRGVKGGQVGDVMIARAHQQKIIRIGDDCR
jgi:pSer/pThr/pTyr-binding forkhead associated (FHA) protein